MDEYVDAFIEALKEFQNGECPICGAPVEVLDGSYRTGKPRGWLCGPCNVGLGWFRDSQKRLRAALRYLANPPVRRAGLNTGAKAA